MKKRLYLILNPHQIDKISDLPIPEGFTLEGLGHECNYGERLEMKINCECGDSQDCHMFIATQSHYLMEMEGDTKINDDDLASKLIEGYRNRGFNLELIEDDIDRVTFYSKEIVPPTIKVDKESKALYSPIVNEF